MQSRNRELGRFPAISADGHTFMVIRLVTEHDLASPVGGHRQWQGVRVEYRGVDGDEVTENEDRTFTIVSSNTRVRRI